MHNIDEYVVETIIGKSESIISTLPTVTIYRVKEKNTSQSSEGETKIIKKIDLTFLDSHSIDTYIKIIRSVIKLNHCNIIRYFNYKISTNKLLILMEDIGSDSKTLEEFIDESGRLPNETIVSIFTQLVSAIKYLHDRKIVHRNICPDNIYIKETNTNQYMIKIGGFTSSKALEYTKEMMKTYNYENIQYMAPEIQDGLESYTNSVDIWSLGCILYELCTNKHCFMFKQKNYLQLAYSSDKPNISLGRPTWLRELIKQMLSIMPNKRPTTNQILVIDQIKNEFNSLYGEVAYDMEICHTVFHGSESGETPEGMKKTLRFN